MEEATGSLTPLTFACSSPWPGAMETVSELYRRAVLRPPPPRFMIEFLPISTKGSHHHGMRISRLEASGDSISLYSRSTRSSRWQYEIWRKWEDVLWFQQTLESEYSRAAREKKVRLAQGKGVKSFHGLYKQDMASSFESLPPGPLPSSVAQDVHEYLPRVTKKGTIFRANLSTIDQRQRELRALVEALYSDSIPTLVRELRDTKRVKDFFGFWRRDYDCMANVPRADRGSITSSVFATYFEYPLTKSEFSATTTTPTSTSCPTATISVTPPSPSIKTASAPSSIIMVRVKQNIPIEDVPSGPRKRDSGSSEDMPGGTSDSGSSEGVPLRNRDSGSSFECPSSPTRSEFSMATTTATSCATSTVSDTPPLSIKAVHGSSIIMVRVERNVPLETVRQRVYNKFVGQEGVPLSNDFAIAMAVPSTASPSSSCECSASSSDKSELHFIDTQYDWEQIVLVRESNKVTLKILDTPRA